MWYVAFWKGLLYNENNLDLISQDIEKLGKDSIINLKNEILDKGFNFQIFGNDLIDYVNKLFDLAETNLNKMETDYLNLLRKIINENKTPKLKTISNLNQGKKQALQWCILNKKFN